MCLKARNRELFRRFRSAAADSYVNGIGAFPFPFCSCEYKRYKAFPFNGCWTFFFSCSSKAALVSLSIQTVCSVGEQPQKTTENMLLWMRVCNMQVGSQVTNKSSLFYSHFRRFQRLVWKFRFYFYFYFRRTFSFALFLTLRFTIIPARTKRRNAGFTFVLSLSSFFILRVFYSASLPLFFFQCGKTSKQTTAKTQ